ncbi:LOW QUALITY PROTEIN: hypothetical protein HID58_075821 [Brassica napus]|uniref:Jasmonate O-methyltransferase n=2 Tax=Brassica TaxID=3705 RepID=A0ABQ7YLX9_BRANA|nr:LOW QUALITY PROTEIN: hypothetical protein HID58_075821 [Brassica napus]
MEVMQVLHMNKGNGETSYAKNSIVQSNIISLGRRVLDEALKKLMLSNSDISSLGIADLGCSSGPNSLLSISNIVDTIQNVCLDLDRPVPELKVSLNDLPSNDFNYIFASLPEFYDRLKKRHNNNDCLGFDRRGEGPCFVSAVPGSFYGRLFPRQSLHFVHSSSSLHWLSQVPCGEVSKEDGVVITADLDNKGKIYLSKTSPKSVHKAYALQFQSDFLVFLRSRSEEVVPGGTNGLIAPRSSLDPTTEESCYQWELLAQALMSMANEVSPVNWEGGSVTEENYDILRSKPEALASGRRVAKTIRAVIEPMLEPTFGHNVMDELFERYAKIVGEYSYVSSPRYAIVNVSLVKMGLIML